MGSDEGLRARKQRATREAIHSAAVRSALAQGPDAATVADISAEANVSTRTFFNYFPSKEDAMLGFHGELPTDEQLEAFRTSGGSGDLLLDVLDLMRDVFPASSAQGVLRQRRELLGRHPRLMQCQMLRVLSVEQRISAVVASQLLAEAESAGAADAGAADAEAESAGAADVADIQARAQMLVMLASSVMRFAIRRTAQIDEAADDADASPTHHPPNGDGNDPFEASLRIFREVIQQLR